MFKFLKAIRVRRSYLGLVLVSVSLFGMYWLEWQDMKVACSDAEHPEHIKQPSSSLANPIPAQTRRIMKVDPVDSAMQVEEKKAPTPPTSFIILPPEPTTPTQTPPNPKTPVQALPVFRTLPSEAKPIITQLQHLQLIKDPLDHTWISLQTRNTTGWILVLSPEQMALNNEPAHLPPQNITIPESWKENEYNNCFEDLAPLRKITSQAPVVVRGLRLEYGQASFKLLLLLLRILSMFRVEIHLYGHLQLDESLQTEQILVSLAYLLNGLPENISARKTLLQMHTTNTIEYWREILKLVIQTYKDLELRKYPVKFK
ncbi:hypothetical protein NEHOM01_1890 [Nematocida homosporus]|uniref:uncharacterized protein n=1 Tax=Nematocida homosporus TaxID=1912981 RepID=UPI00221F31F4|nr:uncharacterized protein NEHOM01_1890 [Nematocida homosporus]KAI5187045.1 hypothetical protein NEHOM01_1890 [Nematocida homosporus]